MKTDEKESRRRYKYRRDKMSSEDTTERDERKTVVWDLSTAIVGDIYVYTIVAENWTWQGGIRAE